MAGATDLSPTDAAGQGAVVGLAQRVVVARTRAPREAAIPHCLEYVGSKHLGFELGGSARSVVQFEGVLPEAAICVAYASVDRDGQVDIGVDFPPPRCMISFVWSHSWPAASTLNIAVDSSIPFVRQYMTSVLNSDAMRPSAAHTPRSPSSSSSAARVIVRRPRRRRRKTCPRAKSPGLAPRWLISPALRPVSSSDALRRP